MSTEVPQGVAGSASRNARELPVSRGRELPKDRLATTDEKGRRIWVYPADVRGRYSRLRAQTQAVLIVIFLLMPFVTIGGHPAILLDIPNRRFSLLGITFWAHDAPMLFFVIAGAAITLAFVTAVWGRAWCGWACPQTVFVNGVFQRIERWIEGDGISRRKLDAAPWTASKLVRKGAKWTTFAALTLIISHSFLAYFVGTEALARMIRSSPAENPITFGLMTFITAALYFNFAWFREQFCTIVCPYGRFQSVLIDDASRVVAYDAKRGEPRRGAVAAGTETAIAPLFKGDLAPASPKQGDCVDCFRCVQVCPMGIDIRRGHQLECIHCTSCMDACDEVMRRIGKPEKLIRYVQGPALKQPRTWAYGTILLVLAAAFGYRVATRVPVEVTVIRAVEAPYQELGGGVIVNHFKLDLRNQSFDLRRVRFELSDDLRSQRAELVLSNHAETLAAGAPERADAFVRFPKKVLSLGHRDAALKMITEPVDGSHAPQIQTEEVRLVGPFN